MPKAQYEAMMKLAAVGLLRCKLRPLGTGPSKNLAPMHNLSVVLDMLSSPHRLDQASLQEQVGSVIFCYVDNRRLGKMRRGRESACYELLTLLLYCWRQ